jgi:hypothetical protein
VPQGRFERNSDRGRPQIDDLHWPHTFMAEH